MFQSKKMTTVNGYLISIELPSIRVSHHNKNLWHLFEVVMGARLTKTNTQKVIEVYQKPFRVLRLVGVSTCVDVDMRFVFT